MGIKVLYLPIESISRELDSKILLAHSALQKRFGVFLGWKSIIARLAENFGTGAFLYKDHSPWSFELFQRLKQSGVQIFAQDEEGLIFESDEQYSKRISNQSVNLCNSIFAWGDYQAEALNNYLTPDNLDKIKNTGNPRFDIFKPEFNEYLNYLASSIKAKYKSLVLINTNFASGNWNPYLYNEKTYVDHQKALGKIKSLEDEEYYTARSKYYNQLFDDYVEMIRHIAEQFPDIDFIIRPHPDENHDRWRDSLKSITNAKVEYNGSAPYWIQASLCVIHTGCTTGIEAWAMRKPLIRYNSNPHTTFEGRLPNYFGYQAESKTELVKILERILRGELKDTFDEQLSLINPKIKNISGPCAKDEIIQIIDDELNYSTSLTNSASKDLRISEFLSTYLNKVESDNSNLRESSRILPAISFLGLFKSIRQKSRNIKGILKNTNINFRRLIIKKEKQKAELDALKRKARQQKFDQITISDIENRLNLLDNSIGLSSKRKYSIVEIQKDLYFIIDKDQLMS